MNPDPTAKIIAISQLRAVADLAEVCDRESALEIYRQMIRLAKRLKEKLREEK
jgi:hypothetical protein